MTRIIYRVWVNALAGKLELTIAPSDEDDIGLLKGRSFLPMQEKTVGQPASPPMPWKIEETFIGTNDDDIRIEAEAAIREMGGEITDAEIY